jgi:hypothetical protein
MTSQQKRLDAGGYAWYPVFSIQHLRSCTKQNRNCPLRGQTIAMVNLQ